MCQAVELISSKQLSPPVQGQVAGPGTRPLGLQVAPPLPTVVRQDAARPYLQTGMGIISTSLPGSRLAHADAGCHRQQQ